MPVCYKEEQGRGKNNIGIAMAQWINHLQNNIFVNPLPSPLLCKISGQVGGLAGKQAGRQISGEIQKF